MTSQHIGFLHPGAMGISVAATARNSDQFVYWLSSGRSRATRARAEEYQLQEIQTLEEFCATCTLIVSVCPPVAATAVSEQVLACDYRGLYVDANAISPQRTIAIGRSMHERGVDFVDGGIIGGPAWQPDSTVLYLSGAHADRVAECFIAGPLVAEVIGIEPGRASALKMCFAANTKGTTALLCAVLATAEKLGVRTELERQWSRHGSDYARQAGARVQGVTAKAWRFTDEMREIEATLAAAGLPGAFHAAAVDIYERLARFKGAEEIPDLESVLEALLHPAGNGQD